jgi:NADPH:quinone reductase-like Zn-dependent oxidoreductase
MKYKRVVVRRHGPPDALQVEQAELADPGPGEVRVRVQATGVVSA